MIFAALFMVASIAPSALAQKSKSDISMFPAPEAGFKQVVIDLPAKKNEDLLKLEIFVGKEMMVDCNRHFLSGTFNKESVQGWGYDYIVVESDGNVASTRMACPDNTLKNEFVQMQTLLLTYNSKLPVVIYVPESLDVKYRIWKAGKKQLKAKVTQMGVAAEVYPVENKTWQLVELNGQPVNGKADTHFLKFDAKEKRAQAKAGCNVINLPYEMKNEFQIRFGEGMSTMMACPDNLEDQLKEVLRTADNLSFDGKETMTLNKGRMMPLAVFKLVK